MLLWWWCNGVGAVCEGKKQEVSWLAHCSADTNFYFSSIPSASFFRIHHKTSFFFTLAKPHCAIVLCMLQQGISYEMISCISCLSFLIKAAVEPSPFFWARLCVCLCVSDLRWTQLFYAGLLLVFSISLIHITNGSAFLKTREISRVKENSELRSTWDREKAENKENCSVMISLWLSVHVK